MRLITIYILTILFLSQPILAGQVTVKTTQPPPLSVESLNRGIDPIELGHHMSPHDDYGESWFFCGITDKGGVLFGLASCSNYGIRKYQTSMDIWYYSPQSGKFHGHGEYGAGDIHAKKGGFRVKIGRNILSGDPPGYQFLIKEGDIELDMSLVSSHSPAMLGGSKLGFHNGKFSAPRLWSVATLCSAGRMTGKLKIKGSPVEINGYGYLDHGYSTIKVPDFSRDWYVLTASHEEYGLKLIDIRFREGFKPPSIQLCLITEEGKIIANDTYLSMKEGEFVLDEHSGIKAPTVWRVSRDYNNVKLNGLMKRGRFLESIDVLGQVSWFIRKMVQTFYSKPWQLRFLMEYDLELERNGIKKGLKGKGIGEVHLYR